MSLEPVVGNLLPVMPGHPIGRVNGDLREKEHDVGRASGLAVLARHGTLLATIADDAGWRPLTLQPEAMVWSDDYVNIFSILR
jgi:hypothetical protein